MTVFTTIGFGDITAQPQPARIMVAGPQLVSALFLATGKNPKPASSAFLAGVALAVVIGLSVAYWLARLVIGSAGGGGGGARRVVDWVVLALLAVLAVLVYRRRTRTDPPRWMGTLQTASPGFAFGLGEIAFAFQLRRLAAAP